MATSPDAKEHKFKKLLNRFVHGNSDERVVLET